MFVIIVTIEKDCLIQGLNLLSRNSGVVKTFDASKNGINNQIRKVYAPRFAQQKNAVHNPKINDAPTIPMICSELILAAINDVPTTYHGSVRPAKK